MKPNYKKLYEEEKETLKECTDEYEELLAREKETQKKMKEDYGDLLYLMMERADKEYYFNLITKRKNLDIKLLFIAIVLLIILIILK